MKWNEKEKQPEFTTEIQEKIMKTISCDPPLPAEHI